MNKLESTSLEVNGLDYRATGLQTLPSVIAIVVVGALYFLSQPGQLSDYQTRNVAKRYSFEQHSLPNLGKVNGKSIRNVHPSLKHFAGWISFVGAAVSISDLDGDALSNDIVYVDPRFDHVVVCPAPTTEAGRYSAFELKQDELPYAESRTAPMGTLLGDFNVDGYEDILVYFWGRSPIIYLHRAESTSSDSRLDPKSYRAVELVEPAEIWHTNNASRADLDGDGKLDLVIGNYNPDGAMTLDASGSQSEKMLGSWSRSFNGGQNRLFLGTGGSSSGPLFVEQQGVLDDHVARGWTFATGLADLDGDMLPELYFVQDFGPDRLLHNRSEPGMLRFELVHGKRDFVTPRSKTLGRDSFNGMGIDFGDLNRDGLLDVMVSNISSNYGLHQGNFVFVNTGETSQMGQGVAPFREHGEAVGLARGGWAWETKFGDFDNDGVLEVLQATGFLRGTVDRWPELHETAMANEALAISPAIYPQLEESADISGHERNPFFAHDPETGRYHDVSEYLVASGLHGDEVSRGIATADVDGDGRLDLCRANQWDDSYFYKNTSKTNGHFLGLRLRLPIRPTDPSTVVVYGAESLSEPSRQTTAAVGAAVIVEAGELGRIHSFVDGGNGHSGHRSPDIHIGLGDTDGATATIRWRGRDGSIRNHTQHFASGWHTVVLGGSEVTAE